ncbi:MAG TPA: hypothetical protein VFM46_15560, partial [Pseudomonadales bacterium]|nr:hypothetical protein [Pseudomonadales bacterium]
MKPASTVFNLILIAGVALSPLAAEAKLGGTKTHSTSYSQLQSQNNGRLGQGQSVGMQRDSVMSSVRSGNNTASAGGSNYGAPQSTTPSSAPTPPNSGYKPGWGTVAGAAALAGAAGYALGNHDPAPVIAQNAMSGAQITSGAGQTTWPVTQAANTGHSTLWLLLLLGACGAGIYYLSQRQSSVFSNSRNRNISPANAVEYPQSSHAPFKNLTSISEIAETLYRELQEINNAADAARLKLACTPALAAELEPSMGGNTQVISLRAEVIDQSD